MPEAVATVAPAITAHVATFLGSRAHGAGAEFANADDKTGRECADEQKTVCEEMNENGGRYDRLEVKKETRQFFCEETASRFVEPFSGGTN